ncbi:VWA domain-containing protein [Mesorhizobium sp. L-8-10]|uniref:vWA domain-containing protein n=1 Tax=Mesorhizobium sp. L-8-10 TaxID=2744523 RepID=UPI0019284372|nr:VWA domain-containing protein [Mesorhizobium sp. L-8-10]BCH34644.1 VWA domain-containing protein [Mesorhizobium sp. L-8-10]
MAAVFRVIVGLLALAMTAAVSHAADKAIIVLDASGSMWGQIDGKPKLEIARRTLRTVLQSVPADMELGLLAYGHREKGNCADIELVVPPAAGRADAIASAADNLKFLGKTPLTASVRQAAEALRYTEEKATVILITDGLETCEADPCAVGGELEQSGIDFTAHVVGFGLTAEEGRQVACLAENTGGKYIQASDASALEEALVETVVAEPAPEPAPATVPAKPEHNFVPQLVLAEGGEPLSDAGNAYEIHRADAAGGKGERVATEYNDYKGDLDPGDYVVVARLGEASAEQQVRIEEGKVAEPVFVLNAGTLVVRPLASAGAEVSDAAQVVVDHPGEGEAIGYGETRIVVPAGKQQVTVRLGEGEATETAMVEAGGIVERDVVVGVGRALVNAFYVPGMKVEEGGLALNIYKAAKRIDGSREQVSYAYGPDGKFDLPPGDYTAVAKLDEAPAEQDFAVKAGQLVEVGVTLNAGVLAVSAPGARHIEVFAAKKDLQGKRKEFGYAYAETHQTTLPAGDYVVVVDRGDDGEKKEASATVKAGERVEVAVP